MGGQNFLLVNRFDVKLRFCVPRTCKRRLQMKRWRANVGAEKAYKIKTKMNKSKHKQWHWKLEIKSVTNNIFYWNFETNWHKSSRATQQMH